MSLSPVLICQVSAGSIYGQQLEVFTLPHIVQLDSAGLSLDFGLENLVKMGENGCNFLVTVQWTNTKKHQKVTGINSLQIMLYIILIRFLS